MSFPIEQRFLKLDELVHAAEEKGIDPQVQSYFCRLGAVMICGNIERCVEHLITERVGRRSIPQVSSFLKGHFKRGTNYDCERIKELFYRFDKKWGDDFETYVSSNIFVKDSISSCYAVRNQVAHGEPIGLGHKVLRQYFQASFDLVAEMETMLR